MALRYNDFEPTSAGAQEVVNKGLDLYASHRPNPGLPKFDDRCVKRFYTPMAYTLA